MPLNLQNLELFNRNLPYVKDHLRGYTTKLEPQYEQQFKQWASKNQTRLGNIDLDDPHSDYDYRGWWSENKNTPAPEGHFTDKYKTPYHQSFSNESIYAAPTAPRWVQKGKTWNLMDQAGKVLFSEKE